MNAPPVLPGENRAVVSPLRRHDLDALRAAMMLLGIAYHVALSFAAGLPWLVTDRTANRGFYYFQAAVHGFRMPLFFLISGFFTAMLWRGKGLRALLGHRFRRVFLPFLLGLVTVIPAVNWAGKIAMESGRPPKEQTGARASASAPDALWLALFTGDLPGLQTQLKRGASPVELQRESGMTPLAWAAAVGRADLATALLDAGAPVDAPSRDGGTALITAAFFGRAEVAELLLRRGARKDARNGTGMTPAAVARVDFGMVEAIGGALGLKLDRSAVEQGRGKILRQLDAAPAPAHSVVLDLLGALCLIPLFSLLWFLWVLCWLLLVFSLYAIIAQWRRWPARPHPWLLAPGRLLWLLPLTLGLQWLMASEFGPDTPMGLIPLPHVLVYYGLFFFFGVAYFDCQDAPGRVGQGWRWLMPVTLLLIFPVALEFSTGCFGWRNQLLPLRYHHAASAVLQTCYAWLMSFGCMGMFRALLRRENRTLRYLSDASYWFYLAHLPLVILAQAWVRDWPLPALLKFLIITLPLTAFLLVSYDKLVRYTWLGTLLNGKRERPARA